MAFGRGCLAGRQSIACHLRGGSGALSQPGIVNWPASAGAGPGAWPLVLPPFVSDGMPADLGR